MVAGRDMVVFNGDSSDGKAIQICFCRNGTRGEDVASRAYTPKMRKSKTSTYSLYLRNDYALHPSRLVMDYVQNPLFLLEMLALVSEYFCPSEAIAPSLICHA